MTHPDRPTLIRRTPDQLRAQRAALIAGTGLTEDQLREEYELHQLAEKRATAWETVRGIDYLLDQPATESLCGEECAEGHVHAGRCAAQPDPDRHEYLSTGCLHGEHAYCQGRDGRAGEKKPGVCKWCEAKCQCPCHATSKESRR